MNLFFLLTPIFVTLYSSRVKMLLGFAAEQIKNIDTEIEKRKNDGIEYAALQKEAITQALTKGMLVLTGGRAQVKPQH